MALVVDVEPVLDGVFLQIRDEPCKIDHCHCDSLPQSWDSVVGSFVIVNDEDWLPILIEASQRVADELSRFVDLHARGERPDQYAFDLAADAAVLEVLAPTGAGTFSEESGVRKGTTNDTVVIDPVDGSTNASRHIPHYNTSLAVVDDEGVRASVVVNQATGETFSAIRGSGAFLDGEPIGASPCSSLGDAIVVVNGLPSRHLGWAQFRCFGAAALDIAYVAAGRVDAFCDMVSQLGMWDYAAGHLIALEAGACVGEQMGRELLHFEHHGRRGPVYAATPALRDDLIAAIDESRTR